MIKNFTIAILSLFMCYTASGQLPNGSIAPNFTGTDLDGNTYTLYDILDQGKSVVIDVSATWCGPCWNYHTGGTLDALWEEHGPDGADDYMVFMIEADANTNTACLEGNAAACTGGGTWGDWITGTNYPIIEDDNFADLYQISYYPTLYVVCPNRRITEVSQGPVSTFTNAGGACAQPTDGGNASPVQYTGFDGYFCESASFSPTFLVQNMGTDVITSVGLDLMVNGSLVTSTEWAGSLSTYQMDEVVFDEITITEDSDFQIMVTSVNGGTDGNLADNELEFRSLLSGDIADNYVTLEFREVGDFGILESYWQIIDDAGNVLYENGNVRALDPSVPFTTPYVGVTSVTEQIALPSDGCYEFRFFEDLDDGFDNVVYSITNSNGDVLLSGPSEFERRTLDNNFFRLVGGTDVVDNGALTAYSGESESFCYDYSYTPQVTIKNIGSNELTSASVIVSVNGSEVLTQDWSGSIMTGESAIVQIDEVMLDVASDVTFELANVNGVADIEGYRDNISTYFENLVASTETITIEIEYDQWGGDETTWALINSAGVEIAGGAGINSQTLTTEVTLDAEFECYSLILSDAFGDGLTGTSYIKITNGWGVDILNLPLNRVFAFEYTILMEGNQSVSSIDELTTINEFKLYPNPAKDNMTMDFYTDETADLQISIFDNLGQKIRTISHETYTAGNHSTAVDTRDLTNGVYYMRLESAKGQKVQRFVIMD